MRNLPYFKLHNFLVKKARILDFHTMDDQLVKSMQTVNSSNTEGLNNFVQGYSNYIGFGIIFSFRYPLKYSALQPGENYQILPADI